MAASNIINYLINIILTLLIAHIIKFYLSWYTRENPIPGPVPLPLIGNLHQIGLDMGKGALKLQKKYGDIFEIALGPTNAVFVSKAELVENICSSALKNNAFAYRISPNAGMDELNLSNMGIIFNRNLEAWKFNRRVLSQTIMSLKFLKETVECTNQICDELEKCWIQLGPERKINFAKWSSCFITDVTLISTTGKKSCAAAAYYNSLSTSIKTEISESIIKESLKFIDSINTFASSVMFFYNIPPIILHHFPIIKSMYKKYKNNNEWLDNELDKIISTRKQEIENTPLDQPIEHNVLNLLITANTERDTNRSSGIDYTRPLTDIDIRAASKEIFSASMDTTQNATTIALYYILKYPDVKAKLIKEFESVYGDFREKPNITHESLDKLVYTEAVINEVTRIQPPVPVLMRATSFDTEIGGYKIKKGTDVFTNYIGIHTHESHWDEPERFNPDRFLKENSHKIVKNSHLTFGGGIRICPGRYWAIRNMKILFVRLLTKFEVSLVNPDAPLKLEYNGIQHCDELEIYIKEKKIDTVI